MNTIHKVEEKLSHLVKKSPTSDQSPSTTNQSKSSTMAPNLPKTYKAVVLDKPNDPWKLRDVNLELPKAGEVLVKVRACGVCHSDSALQAGLFGPMASFPVVPGHEIVGTVAAVAEGERRWKEGDLVGGPWHGGHDGLCRACNKGDFQMCDHGAVNGVNRNGGYAEYCTLRSEAVVQMPDGIEPADYAPLLCAGVTVFNGIRQMNIPLGGTIAVQGLGGLGHLAIQYAHKMGYRAVALSSSGSKRDFAKDLGATDYVDGSKETPSEALQKIGGADLVLVTAPNPEIMGDLMNGLRARGKVLILAPVGEVPFNTVVAINKGLSMHGWPSGHAQDSVDAMQVAKLSDVKCMIEKFPLEKVEEAVNHMLSGKVRFRAVLTMD